MTLFWSLGNSKQKSERKKQTAKKEGADTALPRTWRLCRRRDCLDGALGYSDKNEIDCDFFFFFF
jgi:hypothetical protein